MPYASASYVLRAAADRDFTDPHHGRVELPVTRHPLHHTTGQYPKMRRTVSEPLDSPVGGDAVDFGTRHADVRQLPVTQVVQAGS